MRVLKEVSPPRLEPGPVEPQGRHLRLVARHLGTELTNAICANKRQALTLPNQEPDKADKRPLNDATATAHHTRACTGKIFAFESQIFRPCSCKPRLVYFYASHIISNTFNHHSLYYAAANILLLSGWDVAALDPL